MDIKRDIRGAAQTLLSSIQSYQVFETGKDQYTLSEEHRCLRGCLIESVGSKKAGDCVTGVKLEGNSKLTGKDTALFAFWDSEYDRSLNKWVTTSIDNLSDLHEVEYRVTIKIEQTIEEIEE